MGIVETSPILVALYSLFDFAKIAVLQLKMQQFGMDAFFQCMSNAAQAYLNPFSLHPFSRDGWMSVKEILQPRLDFACYRAVNTTVSISSDYKIVRYPGA